MRTGIFGVLVLLAAPLLAATVTHAAEPCVFEKYAPASVTPYSEENSLAYGTFSFMRGAQLYIPAQKGLTREWLQSSIERALATRPSAPVLGSGKDVASCNPDVNDVRVAVTSAGNGFWVTLIGPDQKSGETLLKWARVYVARAKAQAQAHIARVTR